MSPVIDLDLELEAVALEAKIWWAQVVQGANDARKRKRIKKKIAESRASVAASILEVDIWWAAYKLSQVNEPEPVPISMDMDVDV